MLTPDFFFKFVAQEEGVGGCVHAELPFPGGGDSPPLGGVSPVGGGLGRAGTLLEAGYG